MAPYSTEEFINSILKNSFQQKHYVDKTQLNRIAYQTAKEIFSMTGQRIIDENFELNFQGPALNTVNIYYLQIHDGRTIQEYMNNHLEQHHFINDEKIQKTIFQVWNKTKSMPLSMMLSNVPTTQRPLISEVDNEFLLAG